MTALEKKSLRGEHILLTLFTNTTTLLYSTLLYSTLLYSTLLSLGKHFPHNTMVRILKKKKGKTGFKDSGSVLNLDKVKGLLQFMRTMAFSGICRLLGELQAVKAVSDCQNNNSQLQSSKTGVYCQNSYQRVRDHGRCV